jgi:hypothetical protein
MIVRYTNDAVPEFDGIILIDCWQPQESEVKKQIFFYRLSDYFSRHAHHYRQVINASMLCRFDYEDQSIVNTMQTYCWDGAYDRCDPTNPNYYNTGILFNGMYQFRGTYSLFSGIRQQLKSLNNCYYIVTHDDFLSHWHSAGSGRAQNWLVAGMSWQNCLHHNSLGLNQLAQMTKFYNMNFYVMEEFVLNDHDENPTEPDFINDTLNWVKYHGTSTYKVQAGYAEINTVS